MPRFASTVESLERFDLNRRIEPRELNPQPVVLTVHTYYPKHFIQYVRDKTNIFYLHSHSNTLQQIFYQVNGEAQ